MPILPKGSVHSHVLYKGLNEPTKGTKPRITATLHVVQSWCKMHKDMQEQREWKSAQEGVVPGHEQWVGCNLRKGNIHIIKNSDN